MITGKQYSKALQERRIAIVGTKYTKNGWTHFKVYEVKAGKLLPVEIESSSYWDKKNNDYSCGAWGTSRLLEIILSIGYSLGLKFEDMPQTYQHLN